MLQGPRDLVIHLSLWGSELFTSPVNSNNGWLSEPLDPDTWLSSSSLPIPHSARGGRPLFWKGPVVDLE